MNSQAANIEQDLDDPNLTKPMVRYNAMVAVLRNTLYMYAAPPFSRFIYNRVLAMGALLSVDHESTHWTISILSSLTNWIDTPVCVRSVLLSPTTQRVAAMMAGTATTIAVMTVAAKLTRKRGMKVSWM